MEHKDSKTDENANANKSPEKDIENESSESEMDDESCESEAESESSESEVEKESSENSKENEKAEANKRKKKSKRVGSLMSSNQEMKRFARITGFGEISNEMWVLSRKVLTSLMENVIIDATDCANKKNKKIVSELEVMEAFQENDHRYLSQTINMIISSFKKNKNLFKVNNF